MRRVFSIVTNILGMVFLYVMLTLAFVKYKEAIEFDYRTQSEWAAPFWHFWVMIMIAASLFLMQLCRDCVSQVYSLFTGRPLLLSDDDEADDDLAISGAEADADAPSQKK